MSVATKFTTPWMGGGPSQANKPITVRNVADTADAVVYSDSHGSAQANPVNTDAKGVLSMFLAPGRYLLKDAAGDTSNITVTPTEDAAPSAVKPRVTSVRGTVTLTPAEVDAGKHVVWNAPAGGIGFDTGDPNDFDDVGLVLSPDSQTIFYPLSPGESQRFDCKVTWSFLAVAADAGKVVDLTVEEGISNNESDSVVVGLSADGTLGVGSGSMHFRDWTPGSWDVGSPAPYQGFAIHIGGVRRPALTGNIAVTVDVAVSAL